MCLVAEGQSGIVGTVTLTSAAPEALLPAPFPTSHPQRMYLSSLAVAESHRRQGIASLLLNSCELLGRAPHPNCSPSLSPQGTSARLKPHHRLCCGALPSQFSTSHWLVYPRSLAVAEPHGWQYMALPS